MVDLRTCWHRESFQQYLSTQREKQSCSRWTTYPGLTHASIPQAMFNSPPAVKQKQHYTGICCCAGGAPNRYHEICFGLFVKTPFFVEKHLLKMRFCCG